MQQLMIVDLRGFGEAENQFLKLFGYKSLYKKIDDKNKDTVLANLIKILNYKEESKQKNATEYLDHEFSLAYQSLIDNVKELNKQYATETIDTCNSIVSHYFHQKQSLVQKK